MDIEEIKQSQEELKSRFKYNYNIPNEINFGGKKSGIFRKKI